MYSLIKSGSRSFINHAKFSSEALKGLHSPNAVAPLVERFRNVWPDAQYQLIGEKIVLPPRTVPESAIRWRMTATFNTNGVLIYSHLRMNPADAKVVMEVNLKDLSLTEEEAQIFLQMIKTRFNPNTKLVTLITRKFANRVENKKYLTLQLEELLAEAKQLNKLRAEYPPLEEVNV